MNKKIIEKRDLANSKNNATGKIVKAGEDSEKARVLNMIPEVYAENHRKRLCHIHDLEYYDNSYNCIGVSVADLVGSQNYAFYTAVRKLNREIIALTNQQSGGIGFLNFDTDMVAYLANETVEEIAEVFRELFLDLNVYARKGCEKAYVTFNFGLDTSQKGQLISFALLKAYEQGDESGKPFIFPNLVFKLKREINMEESSPNYRLYKNALICTSKRMVPTYFNCDSLSNRDAEAEKIGIMGCRTRVVDNLYGEKSGLNRGNIACVTINLVQLAYENVKNSEGYVSALKKVLHYAKDLLLHRYRTLIENADFSAIYHKKYYKDAEYKAAALMLRNGTLSIGFIGLWDAVAVLEQKSWNSIAHMEPYMEYAYHIVKVMREQIDAYKEETGLNFSLLASAAEGVTGNFARYDAERSGKNFGIADKGYYSNSFHVPVHVKAHYNDKIRMEGKFHRLCNGGSITYVELEEMPYGNEEAVREIVECAYGEDCNYIGVNFPLDTCEKCGFSGRMSGTCPVCGGRNIKRLRRVSGYLSETDKFVAGKKYELMDRTSHL